MPASDMPLTLESIISQNTLDCVAGMLVTAISGFTHVRYLPFPRSSHGTSTCSWACSTVLLNM